MNIIHPIHAILEFYMQISGCKHEIMRVRQVSLSKCAKLARYALMWYIRFSY